MGKEINNYSFEYSVLYKLERDIHEVILDSHLDTTNNLLVKFKSLFKDKILIKYQPFFTKLGIHAGGYFFANPWNKSSEFYRSELSKFEDIQKNYNTSYVFFDKNKDTEFFKELIHELFIISRGSQKIQYLNDKEAYSSDFYNWIPLPDDNLSLVEDEKLDREEYQIHYCTLGEIIYTCFVWRILNSFDLSTQTFEKRIKWGGRFFEFSLTNKYNGYKIENEIFKDLNEGTSVINNELKLHKLYDHKNSNTYILSVLKFILSCGINEDKCDFERAKNDTQYLFDFLFDSFPEFLKRLKINTESPSAIELERKARFPILPYFVWNAIDAFPHTYFVTSIWNSVHNKYRIKTVNESTKDVVFAGFTLCATAPIWNESDKFKDWSLPNTITPGNTEGIIESSLFYIKRVLEVLSKPLVELAYYDNYREAMLYAKKKEIIAGIMARNLSHNFGSHILGNSFLYNNLGIINKSSDVSIKKVEEQSESIILKNVSKFHHYIQARLDFISRIISNAPTQFETIFFFNDLIDKFTIQDALINTLVIDCGYTQETFSFEIIIDKIKYTYDNGKNFFVDKLGNPPDDFLIAIPGGNTGCHAFYSIVENQIRNAVKYGRKQNDFIFTIELKKRENESLVFDIYTYENSSKLDKIDEIKGLLIANIVDSDGSKNSSITGSGITEIKTCAEFLINKRKSERIECVNHNESLSYKFSLYRPVIIGYYALGKREIEGKKTTYSEITEFNYKSQFASIGSYFGVLIDEGITDYEKDKFIAYLEKNHFKFPYRLLLFTNAYTVNEWHSKLIDSAVPTKRVKVTNNDVLKNKIKNGNNNFEEVVVELYEEWLQLFKPLISNNKYNLLVGFQDRNINVYKDIISGFSSPLLDIYICSQNKEGNITEVYSSNSQELYTKKLNFSSLPKDFANRCIVYDNHGEVFTNLLKNKSVNYYHNFGNNNIELFQELFNPPSNQYNFKFFIYSLIESSLLQVLIVDERISGAYLDKMDLDKNNLRYTNIQIASAVNQNSIISNQKEYFELEISDNPVFKTSEFNYSYFDAIIFHHGIFEKLKENNVIDYSLLQNLIKITPVLIWTSGRGYDLERDPNIVNAQFMDFNELNYSTYVSFNKFDLGKAIMSKYGKEDE